MNFSWLTECGANILESPLANRAKNKPHSPPVLFVADFFHPVDNLAVELFLNRDVRHGRGWGSSMPVLLAGREPDHITGPDILDGSAFALRPAAARSDDKRLPQRMRVPCRPRARLESHAGALDQCRIGRLKKRINPYSAREPLGRSFAGRLRTNSFDFHFLNSL